MKTTKTSALSILIAGLACAFPVQQSHARKHGGGEGEGGEGGEHVKKGVELMDQKHFDQAAEEFGKAIAAAPGDARLYHNRAIAYFDAAQAAEAAHDQTGAGTRYMSAVTDFSKEIELAPKSDAGYIGRAQAEVMQRQYDPAIADLTKALELKPDDVLALRLRGFADIGISQWDKAVADFSAVIQKEPNDLQSYDRRAWAYRNLNKPDAAIADYTIMIEKSPNDGETFAKRGYTYGLQQQYKRRSPITNRR